jgi:TPR repeat protein
VSGLFSAFISIAFFSYAFVSWHPTEGFLSKLQSGFILIAACLFGLKAAFNFFCAQSGRVPSNARKMEVVSNRILVTGGVGFVAIALAYAGLVASGVIQPDFAAARARYERAALAGDAEAMTRLAGQYRDGRGGPQDYVKSREWYEKAAAAGDSSAMFWLGWFHHKGLGGVRQDYTTAHEWFLKAAAKGDGAAMTWLASDAQFGLGGAKDYGESRFWYEKAAAGGNLSAMNSLGNLFLNGWGVPLDYVKARDWYERAAAVGSTASMNELGVMYVNGWGVTRDLAKAQEWYEKAAAGSQLDGMQHLAIMLDKGDAGPADRQRAGHLLLQTAKLGHQWSKTMLDGPMLIFAPATRTAIKQELAHLGHYHGPIDGTWNDEARAAVAAYLKVPG